MQETINFKKTINIRCIKFGRYIVKNFATVRATAKKFNISKSTVHKDVSIRLKNIDPKLYEEVHNILKLNKQERHIRGGIATRRKYKENKELN